MRSRWCRLALAQTPGRTLALTIVLALSPGVAPTIGGPTSLAAQDDEIAAACAAMPPGGSAAECRLAAGAARMMQPRLATALWGGNPVPGTASTLGMRIASMPRLSLAGRVTLAPVERPPLLDRTQRKGEGALLTGFNVDGAVGLLSGFSPFATVGGLLSLDLIGRLGWAPLPEGFEQCGVLGWALGARVGIFRESFTLPGLSVTGTYGRIGEVAYGDPDGGTTDGFFEGAVNDLRLGVSAGKRLGMVGVTAGAAYDRYSSDLTIGFPGAPLSGVAGEAVHERWSAYANAAWTLVIFHVVAELGWQEAPVPEGLPLGVDVDPAGWFAGLAFRASI